MTPRKPPTKSDALRLLRSHEQIGPVLARGGEVVTVEPQRGRGGNDKLVAAIYDHAEGRSLVALVDSNGVTGVHETPAKFQLSEQERELVEKLAVTDSRVKSFLRRRRMNPLTRLYFPPGDTSGHRFAIVFARPTSSERLYAVVDLTDKRVTEILDQNDLVQGAND
jgi:hypothetical protein